MRKLACADIFSVHTSSSLQSTIRQRIRPAFTMMFKAASIAALVAVAAATDSNCYTYRRGRAIGKRIGRAFCKLSSDDVENGLPDAPLVPDYCVDSALARCERVFASFVNKNCEDNKALFKDTYEEYKDYCEGTLDDIEDVPPPPPAPQQPTVTVCTWGVDCPGSVNVCAPGDYSCSCPNGYDCTYPNNWDSYPQPCYGYGCNKPDPNPPCTGYGCNKPDPKPCQGYGCKPDPKPCQGYGCKPDPKPCQGYGCNDAEPQPEPEPTTYGQTTTDVETTIEPAPAPTTEVVESMAESS